MTTVWYLVLVYLSYHGGMASVKIPEPSEQECMRIGRWEKEHSDLYDVQCIQGVK